MAKINDTTTAAATVKTPGALDFDKIDGARASVVDRPMIQWKKLAGRANDNKDFVVAGRVIEVQLLNNPKGSDRQDDGFLAAIVELTHPCQAVVGDEIITAEKGREVFVPFGSENSNLGKHLMPLIGHAEMFWVAIRPNGEIETSAGKNPMRRFEVKVGDKGEYAPVKRTGRYLLGGASGGAAALTAPNGVTKAERDAAKSEAAALNG